MSRSSIRISEIFGPTLQGEGALIGKPTVFVRTGGCDYRCLWCDSVYAVNPDYRHEWKVMSEAEIMAEVKTLAPEPMLVSLSGGNPAIPDLSHLIDLGKQDGYSFAMETQGSIARDWFNKLDYLTLSPKGPSSGHDFDLEALQACITAAGPTCHTSLKIVIFDEADYQFAKMVQNHIPDLALYLQAGNHTPAAPHPDGANGLDINGILARLRWLMERVAGERWLKATVLPQLHVLAWGNDRGV